MNTLIDIPVAATHANGEIVVHMQSGLKFSFPCARYPRLASASHDALSNMELSPMGLHWPELDEDLSIRGLLRDHLKS